MSGKQAKAIRRKAVQLAHREEQQLLFELGRALSKAPLGTRAWFCLDILTSGSRWGKAMVPAMVLAAGCLAGLGLFELVAAAAR